MFRWVRRFFATNLTEDKVKVAEQMLFDSVSIKIDQQIADSTAKLAEAFCKNSIPGVVDTGIFLFVKVPDENGKFRIFAKRLNIQERMRLNDEPNLLDVPENLLDQFSLTQFDAKILPNLPIEQKS